MRWNCASEDVEIAVSQRLSYPPIDSIRRDSRSHRFVPEIDRKRAGRTRTKDINILKTNGISGNDRAIQVCRSSRADSSAFLCFGGND